jgi:carboxyl-terminal processing protease
MRRYRTITAATGAVVVSALLGGLLGGKVLATQDGVAEHYRVFTAALDAIQEHYVEKVSPERLVYSAISGLLQTLDPHSSFMDPRTYAQLRERQEGRYYGLGITIQVIDGDITVVRVFEGSPAYRKGLRRGDVIARIEGEDAKGWTSDQAVRRLRGPRGTSVTIAIRRVGYEELIPLTVERDEIHIPTIGGAFLLDEQTGYIKLEDFSEATDRDLTQALRELASRGMRRLLLDLRNNPGGPLDQAIKVANRFLPRGQLIVYTRGRVPNADQDYYATEDSEFVDLPLVVLVNRNSASASEIVAGAIQDHDRGLIVGETTFGKALVQSIYRVSLNAGLALTTARYYTPSGRLIQRPWDAAFDEYLTYTMRDQVAPPSRSKADARRTDAGRTVYGGGGIEPDHHVPGPIEGFNPTRFGRLLFARQLFERYAERFSAEGDTRIRLESRNRRVVARGFTVDGAMVEDFKQFLRGEGVAIDEAAFASDLEFIKAMIRYQIELALFGVEEARRHLITKDPQAQFALSVFPEAEQLAQAARRAVAAGRRR